MKDKTKALKKVWSKDLVYERTVRLLSRTPHSFPKANAKDKNLARQTIGILYRSILSNNLESKSFIF